MSNISTKLAIPRPLKLQFQNPKSPTQLYWTHKPRKQKNQNNSKSKLGKRENHEKQTLGPWLTAAPVCFQAPRTAPATSVAVSFGVWCGGGLGKQRTAQPQRRKQRARRELFLLWGSRGEWRGGSRGCEHELLFFIFFLGHSVSLNDGPDVANNYWLA